MLITHLRCYKLYLPLQDDRSCQDEDMQTIQSEDDRESLEDEEERASKHNKLTEQVEAVGAQVKQLQVRQTTSQIAILCMQQTSRP
jgi:hypothetical protein